ncbi:hypothetical protein [Poriferisphaera sp. WC338]
MSDNRGQGEEKGSIGYGGTSASYYEERGDFARQEILCIGKR